MQEHQRQAIAAKCHAQRAAEQLLIAYYESTMHMTAIRYAEAIKTLERATEQAKAALELLKAEHRLVDYSEPKFRVVEGGQQ